MRQKKQSFKIYILSTEYILGDEMIENKMVRTSSTHGSYKNRIQNIVGKGAGVGHFKVEASLYFK